jgi:hypothetical protein
VTLCTKLERRVSWNEEKWGERTRRYAGQVSTTHQLRSERFDSEFKHVRVWYEDRRGYLCLEASLPRVVRGHNIDEIDESGVSVAVARLDELLSWAFDQSVFAPLPSVAEWNVRRADVLFNFKPRRHSFAATLEALVSRVQPTGRMNVHRINHESVYFGHVGRGYRKRVEIAFYDKRREVLAHDPSRHDLARGIVRIEVRLFGQDSVRKAFGYQDSPPFREIGIVAATRRVILAKLARLHVAPGLESILVGFESLAGRIGAKRARRLWPYAQLRARAPAREVGAELGLCEETTRRYDRELRDAGLYPAAVSVPGILEELTAALQRDATTTVRRASRARRTADATESNVPSRA